MFVKERQRGDLHRFWGGDSNTQRKPEKEHQSVFNNCLTGMLEELSLNEQYETRDFKSEEFCNDIKRDINSPKDIMEDLDTVSEENEFCDDLDETDYFDSEDEYWEKSKNKKIEDNPSVCAYCLSYHLPRSVHEYKDCKSTVCDLLFFYHQLSMKTRRVEKNQKYMCPQNISKKVVFLILMYRTCV